MKTTLLRDLVEDRIAGTWADWSARHPHLAAAIDRTRLTDDVVGSLQDDEELTRLLREADLDTAHLRAALRLVRLADGIIHQAMRL